MSCERRSNFSIWSIMGSSSPIASRAITAVTHLLLERLPHQPHDIGQFLDRRQADLHIAIAPTAETGYVLTDAAWVVDLVKREVEEERQTPGLRDDIHKVR